MSTDSLDSIQLAVNSGQWELAVSLVNDFKALNPINYATDVFAILEGSIFIQQQNYKKALECISYGLKYNIYNYELYFMLGRIKEFEEKFTQAYFSYENAILYADGDDKLILEDYFCSFQEQYHVHPGKVAIIIVTYENLSYTKACIDSISCTVSPGSYEIIIIDNHSTDGTKEWLEQSSYKYIVNCENKGFPAACNQGILLAEKNSDIFLLNNDTLLMTNSLFNLKMGLYENEIIGVTGSVSNYVSNQQLIPHSFNTVNEYILYGDEINFYSTDQYEYRIKLIGFAILFKRNLLDKVGYLDENYGLGHYEDDDISIRFLKEGYRLMLCRNSFIFHYGNRSFDILKEEDIQLHDSHILNNEKYFLSKWGLKLDYYTHIRHDLLQFINEPRDKKMNILEIGCGCGSTLLKLQSQYPNANIYGTELIEAVVNVSQNIMDIRCENIEDKNLTYPLHSFDYIIIGDVLEHLHTPEETLKYLADYLRQDGCLIVSIPNLMNHSVLIPLLKGNFEYKDAGILDQTHLRFFTLNSIISMFSKTCYQIMDLKTVNNIVSEEAEQYIDMLCTMDPDIKTQCLRAYQYLLKVKPVS